MISGLAKPRPERVVTAANANAVDRAGAWQAVEIAQRLLNERARAVNLPAIGALERARRTFNASASTDRSDFRASLWRQVQDAQARVNSAARMSFWAEQFAAELTALDDALAYYHGIGGATDRAPGDGGNS